MFYKIFKSKCPQYLLSKYLKKVFACYKKYWQYPFFNIKHNFYKNFFSCRRSLSGTTQILTFRIQNILVFSKIIFLNILDPNQSFFNWRNYKGIRLITRLRLQLSHLCDQKFKCNFQNCLDLLCSCGSSTESTSHFLLHCPIFNDKRHTFLSTLNNIDCEILEPTDSYLT